MFSPSSKMAAHPTFISFHHLFTSLSALAPFPTYRILWLWYVCVHVYLVFAWIYLMIIINIQLMSLFIHESHFFFIYIFASTARNDNIYMLYTLKYNEKLAHTIFDSIYGRRTTAKAHKQNRRAKKNYHTSGFAYGRKGKNNINGQSKTTWKD